MDLTDCLDLNCLFCCFRLLTTANHMTYRYLCMYVDMQTADVRSCSCDQYSPRANAYIQCMWVCGCVGVWVYAFAFVHTCIWGGYG